MPIAYCRLKGLYLLNIDVVHHRCRWKGKSCYNRACKHFIDLSDKERRIGLSPDLIAEYDEYRRLLMERRARENGKEEDCRREEPSGSDKQPEGLASAVGNPAEGGAHAEEEGPGLIQEKGEA